MPERMAVGRCFNIDQHLPNCDCALPREHVATVTLTLPLDVATRLYEGTLDEHDAEVIRVALTEASTNIRRL